MLSVIFPKEVSTKLPPNPQATTTVEDKRRLLALWCTEPFWGQSASARTATSVASVEAAWCRPQSEPQRFGAVREASLTYI